MQVGFRSWNNFEKELRRLKQLYDYTVHAYREEHERLEPLAKDADPGDSLTTRVGETTHEIISVYYATNRFYPNKLRELLLISLVTILEAYLANLVDEIFERRLSPFLGSGEVDMKLSRLLSFRSIEAVRDSYIKKESRKISSKGFNERKSYFNKKFGIDFGELGVDLSKINEIHERRHIFVHRNGVCDEKYAHKYPNNGYRHGDEMEVSHEYIMSAFNIFYDFALALRDEAISKYPNSNRKREVVKGEGAVNKEEDVSMLVRGEFKGNQKEVISKLKDTEVSSLDDKFNKYLAQIIIEEDKCIIIVSGNFEKISRYFNPIKHIDGLVVRSISKLYV